MQLIITKHKETLTTFPQCLYLNKKADCTRNVVSVAPCLVIMKKNSHNILALFHLISKMFKKRESLLQWTLRSSYPGNLSNRSQVRIPLVCLPSFFWIVRRRLYSQPIPSPWSLQPACKDWQKPSWLVDAKTRIGLGPRRNSFIIFARFI
jgi:hypothetical protein